MNKKASRIEKSVKARSKMRELGATSYQFIETRQSIFMLRLFLRDGTVTVASASTVQADMRNRLFNSTGNIEAATAVGKAVAEKAKLLVLL